MRALVWAANVGSIAALAGGLTLWAVGTPAVAWAVGLGVLGAAAVAVAAFHLGHGAFHAEAKHWQESERVRNLMRGSVQGVVVHRNHKPVFVNDSYARLFGFDSPEQVMALDSLLELAAPQSRELLRQRCTDRMAGKPAPARYEFQGVHRSGRRIWLETFAMKVPWGNEELIQSTTIDITDRKLAEEALRLSEVAHRSLFETNRRILEHSPAGIILLDQNLRIVFENNGIRRILGIDADHPSSSAGLTLAECALFRAAPVAGAITKLHRRQGVSLDNTFTNAQGKRFHLAVQAVPIFEEDSLTGAVVLVNDVTERREYEEALRRQDALLKVIADARNVLVSVADLDQAIGTVLASLGTQLGVDRALLYRHQPADGAQEARAVMGQEWYANGLSPFSEGGGLRVLRYSDRGFTYWLERLSAGSPIHEPVAESPADERRRLEAIGVQARIVVPVFEGAAFSGYLALLDHRQERRWSAAEQEILLALAETLGHCFERKHAQERERENEARFASMTSNIPAVVFQCVQLPDGTRGFPFVSPHGLAALGLDGERLKRNAEPIFRAIHPVDRIVCERIFAEAARTLAPKRWEGRYFTPEGEMRWAQVLAQTSRLDNGNIVWDGLFLDVTKRKRIDLEQLQSHELDIVQAWTRELEETWHPALIGIEASLRGADAGDAHVAQALALTRQALKHFEAPLASKPPLAPVGVLKEVIGTTLRGTNVEYQLDISPDIDRIAADAEAVREILANLMVLSLQALPAGGRLSIRAANVRTDGQAAGLKPGYYVRITVRDEHQGVDAGTWRTLLERGHAQGTDGAVAGVQGGLATVLSWVTEQNGWLSAQGDPTKGSLFTLYLPSATLSLIRPADEPAREAIPQGARVS